MKQADLFGAARDAAPARRPAEVATPAVPSPVPAWRRPAPAREQPPPATDGPHVITVSELTAQVKELLEPRFARVLVRGEVTNFRGASARGHLYFALKDSRASIDVKVWASQAARLRFQLKDGLAVVVEGSVDVYEPQGRYSLIAQRVEPEGVGALALAFEQIKVKLSKEGLIGEGRTRPRRSLPMLPRRIGVVTSVTGAALRDFLKVLHRRHPRLAVLVADARVQGDGAAADVCRAIAWMSRQDIDCLVVTRGGGSVEDLWTFNEERVVRALWDCPVPTVSAIGHEIDTTLSDLVADIRAPTPSAAAELIAPPLAELEAQLKLSRARLARAVERVILSERQGLRAAAAALVDPRRALSRYRLDLADAAERAARVLRRRTRDEGARLKELTRRLQAARPQAQLEGRKSQLRALSQRLDVAVRGRLRREQGVVVAARVALAARTPAAAIRQARQRVDDLDRRLRRAMVTLTRQRREAAGALAARLELLSPLAVLGRGYAIARREDGRVVRRAAEVQRGESLSLRLAEGAARVRVEETDGPET